VRLFELSIGLVEDIRSGSSVLLGAPGYSPQFQLAFPYRGLFVWHVGGDEVVGDANQAIFVAGGEEYRLDQPLESGFAELMFTPSTEVLTELMGSGEGALGARTAFRQRSRRMEPTLQSFRSQFLGWAWSGAGENTLAAEELVLSLVRAALVGQGPFRVQRSPQRLLRRTKEFLEAELGRPIKLAEIGRMVGASPTYLTHLFRAVEGIPLHRYLTQLRLARALVELPHASDLTALALELGFSSHSHFSAAFRRAFGLTPSAFRGGLGRPPRPLAVSAGATSPPAAPAPHRRVAR
jgi:AraC family transcriptional regulator